MFLNFYNSSSSKYSVVKKTNIVLKFYNTKKMKTVFENFLLKIQTKENHANSAFDFLWEHFLRAIFFVLKSAYHLNHVKYC